MFNVFIRLIFIILVSTFLNFDYFLKNTRFSFIKDNIILRNLSSVLKLDYSFWVVYILFYIMFITNLLGNVPLRSIPTLFYSQTLTISLMFWVPIIRCVYLTQLKSFLAHILPYGSPVGLMLFLPLVEIFSQIIRPLTLMIRLSTNLSRGHIILYMFSYFSVIRSSFSITFIIQILVVLEIFISLLQSYIFVALISLYIVETV